MKRWHDFESAQRIKRDEAVDAIRRHISSGRVKNVGEKLRYASEIEASPDEMIVFAPTKDRWGSSPMNPNAWRTQSGKPIRRSPPSR
jgi:hypothetical protein